MQPRSGRGGHSEEDKRVDARVGNVVEAGKKDRGVGVGGFPFTGRYARTTSLHIRWLGLDTPLQCVGGSRWRHPPGAVPAWPGSVHMDGKGDSAAPRSPLPWKMKPLVPPLGGRGTTAARSNKGRPRPPGGRVLGPCVEEQPPRRVAGTILAKEAPTGGQQLPSTRGKGRCGRRGTGGDGGGRQRRRGAEVAVRDASLHSGDVDGSGGRQDGVIEEGTACVGASGRH